MQQLAWVQPRTPHGEFGRKQVCCIFASCVPNFTMLKLFIFLPEMLWKVQIRGRVVVCCDKKIFYKKSINQA